MIKYDSTMVTFTEVPDEISLCFNLSCCPCHCKDCFEPWLWENRGKELTLAGVESALKKCNHCTCICFLGGDNDHTYLADLIDKIKAKHNIKIAVYSGLSTLDNALLQRVDYYKVGPFIKEKGPLNNKNTNQRFYKISDGKLMDITYKFQKERV